VSFTKDGNVLIVTERLTNLIDTFALGDDGLAVSHQTSSSRQSEFQLECGASMIRGIDQIPRRIL
jgi:hypothetical protein